MIFARGMKGALPTMFTRSTKSNIIWPTMNFTWNFLSSLTWGLNEWRKYFTFSREVWKEPQSNGSSPSIGPLSASVFVDWGRAPVTTDSNAWTDLEVDRRKSIRKLRKKWLLHPRWSSWSKLQGTPAQILQGVSGQPIGVSQTRGPATAFWNGELFGRTFHTPFLCMKGKTVGQC